MPSYKALIPPNLPGVTLKNGTNVLIVEATDATDAAALIQGHQLAQDDQLWSNATISEITVGTDLSPVVNQDSGQTNSYVLNVAIAGAGTNASFSYTAVSADSYADVFAAMVILLNDHADIAGAAFAGNVLTVAAIGDNIGDHTVIATFTYGGVNIASFLGAITDGGIAGATLEIATSTSVVAPVISHHIQIS